MKSFINSLYLLVNVDTVKPDILAAIIFDEFVRSLKIGGYLFGQFAGREIILFISSSMVFIDK
jgi:hypothetical protein